VSFPLYQLLKQLEDFYEIYWGDRAIEGDIDTIILMP
jgi:hypothetical protein